MINHDPVHIVDLFQCLNKSNISYLLLRNLDSELPFHLQHGKDIDILVEEQSLIRTLQLLSSLGFHQVRHPYDHILPLYNTKPPLMYVNSSGLMIDITTKYLVRSIDRLFWVPIHESIQGSLFLNKETVLMVNGLHVPMPSKIDSVVTSVARCVFDKNSFPTSYCHFLNNNLRGMSLHFLIEPFQHIFFAYTPRLIQMLDNGLYSDIYLDYITFSNY